MRALPFLLKQGDRFEGRLSNGRPRTDIQAYADAFALAFGCNVMLLVLGAPLSLRLAIAETTGTAESSRKAARYCA
jgi:hypothetical protein